MGVLYYIIMPELLLSWTSLRMPSEKVTANNLMYHIHMYIEGAYLPLPHVSDIDFSLLTDQVRSYFYRKCSMLLFRVSGCYYFNILPPIPAR